MIKQSVFDLSVQNQEVSGKIVAGLERIGEAYRVLLWNHAKKIGLSPIQIQILIFVSYHDIKWSNVSHLAKEFNVTKPTISDAVNVLVKKGLLEKEPSSVDKRAYSLILTKPGKEILNETAHFANPILEIIKLHFDKDAQNQFYTQLSRLIYLLNQKEILTVQRTCFNCQFYHKKGREKHFCKLLEMDLKNEDIRLDCPEFEAHQ